MTPGIQPHNVSNNTIRNEPQFLSITAKGGKIIANSTLINDIIICFKLFVKLYNK